MQNWSTNTEALSQDKEKYEIWKFEQLVNFGLGEEKIKEEDLRKYFQKLQIDPARRDFLEILLRD